MLILIQRDAGAIELSVHPPLAIGRSHDEATARASAQSHGQNLDEERHSGAWGRQRRSARQVQRYVDAGITHRIMAMGAPFGLDALQRCADEVMAAFRLDPLSA